jgi:hypothetical protein
MSDHSSCFIYSTVFRYLAKSPAPDKRAAVRFWRESAEFDFAPEDMCCDKELEKLGLAKRSRDEDGHPCFVYRGYGR